MTKYIHTGETRKAHTLRKGFVISLTGRVGDVAVITDIIIRNTENGKRVFIRLDSGMTGRLHLMDMVKVYEAKDG